MSPFLSSFSLSRSFSSIPPLPFLTINSCYSSSFLPLLSLSSLTFVSLYPSSFLFSLSLPSLSPSTLPSPPFLTIFLRSLLFLLFILEIQGELLLFLFPPHHYNCYKEQNDDEKKEISFRKFATQYTRQARGSTDKVENQSQWDI